MLAIDSQHLLWAGLICSLACQTRGDLLGVFCATLVKHFALDQKGLRQLREVKTPIERIRAPHAPGLLSAIRVEEIAALSHHVLGQAGASFRQDMAGSVCWLIGMTRFPADAQARTDEALGRLIALEIAAEMDSRLRLAACRPCCYVAILLYCYE